ncbi:MAG: type II toxin-antitoxin system RatA family toxin [Alphaproteobacteria bacterium]|jgi:coenzyme Q-binding protein COQ10|tara:strand:- start:860 stop:1297 length:438 start_codon:yes stop_codon:yes gene_type:complete
MKESNKSIEFNYNAKELFDIVLDIEKYPDYIPWCKKINILKKNKNSIKANMIVNYKLLPTQQFISIVTYDVKNLLIKTQYIEGPLKNLDTIWKFVKIEKNKTIVNFNIKFEFKNFFHQKISEVFYSLVENKMMESFEKRAKKILN